MVDPRRRSSSQARCHTAPRLGRGVPGVQRHPDPATGPHSPSSGSAGEGQGGGGLVLCRNHPRVNSIESSRQPGRVRHADRSTANGGSAARASSDQAGRSRLMAKSCKFHRADHTPSNDRSPRDNRTSPVFRSREVGPEGIVEGSHGWSDATHPATRGHEMRNQSRPEGPTESPDRARAAPPTTGPGRAPSNNRIGPVLRSQHHFNRVPRAT